MTGKPDFDVSAAHKYFAADCFNRAWDLIDKSQRTPAEDAAMIHLSLASLWHWTQRDDCTETNLSIGYWQAARVYALAGQADMARRYARLCLEVSQGDAILPFYQGYAYEALARAESVAGNADLTAAYLAEARLVADTLPDSEDRQQLLNDLATIR